MALWVARAGKYGEREQFALDNNVVAVGWPDVPDLSGIGDREQLLELLSQTYPDHKLNTIKNWMGQLWIFAREIKVGDIVALPMKTRSAVAFGRITGDYRHDPNAPVDARHQRPVKWINTDIARIKIEQDLRFSLGGAMTVFAVKRNNAEARLTALLENKPMPVDQENGEDPDSDAITIDIHRQAEDQIVDFIGRKFRGHDLANLVAGVLTAQGYKVRNSPPGADGGVDIVAGRGPMGFETPRLCVQVKSGVESVDVTVLRELQGVMKNYRAEQGLIVSWGGFKQSVYREARQLFFEIRLWGQSELVQAIQEVYESLSEELQAELPMKRTWLLVVDEND